MKSHWREASRTIIGKVLFHAKGKSEKEIKKALREAYPFGPRAMHPYKIWLDEIKRQRGLKPPLGVKKEIINQDQIELF